MKLFRTALIASVSLAVLAFNETCETVEVVGSDGKPLRINADDFDAAVHTLYAADAAAPTPVDPVTPQPVATPPVAPVTPQPVAPATQAAATPPVAPVTVPAGLQLAKEGTGAKAKLFVVDPANGNAKVTGVPGINEAGYATEADGWAAIMALPTAQA